MQLQGKRVVVMGLGRFGGGVGVTRFLADQGADVLVTDLLPAEQLQQSVDQLGGLPRVAFVLGEHREEHFTSAELIIVNPAVDARQNRYLQAALGAGVPLTSEIRLLTQHLPSRERTIGITGTAGKSTVTAMLGHILRRTLGDKSVHVGGNLGGSLLGEIDSIQPDDWVVLELSSFMLEGLREDQWSPHVAVVTNFSPNHLDRHGTVQSYQQAKQAILDHQPHETDVAILGPGASNHFASRVRSTVFVDADVARDLLPLLLPGRHNQINARLAIAAAERAGVGEADAAGALRDFPGLPHRLQFVADRNGVRWFNDSKSTTPEAATLAIEAFPPHTVHIILGGYDKGSDLGALAKLAGSRCRAVYTIGKTGDAIASAAAGGAAEVVRCGDLNTAVSEAARRAKAGEVVVLSPGCASYDQFQNYEQRGQRFGELVASL